MHPTMRLALRTLRSAAVILNETTEKIDRNRMTESAITAMVASAQRKIERIVQNELQRSFRDHLFQGQDGIPRRAPVPTAEAESTTEQQDPVDRTDHVTRCWVLNALDGKKNFIHNAPTYAIMLVCLRDDQPEHVCILNPVTDTEYYATRGQGAQCNGQRMRLAKENHLPQSLFAISVPETASPQVMTEQPLAHLLSHVQGVRMLGSTALTLAHIANGHIHAGWFNGLNTVEKAAISLMIREAGGFAVMPDQLDELQQLLVGSPQIINKMMNIIRSKKNS